MVFLVWGAGCTETMGARKTRSEAPGGPGGGGEKGPDSEHILKLRLVGGPAEGPDVGCERGESGRPPKFSFRAPED